MTAADLAAELDVSVRTVYRDMDALSAAGVPVYAESGPHGGCQLLDGYRFPLRGLRPEEAEVLLILGVPAVLRDLGLDGPAASRALVHLDKPPWFRNEEPAPELRVLAQALRQQRRLELRYARVSGPAQGARPRTVDPLGLVNKAGIWYLVAASRARITVFRCGRIVSARVLAEPASRPDGFDLAGFWAGWSEEFAASRPRLAVTVLMSPLAQAILPEVFGDQVRGALAAAGEPAADGRRELTLSFEHELAAAQRLAGFGGDVEVISPAAVRDRLLDTARGILSRYA